MKVKMAKGNRPNWINIRPWNSRNEGLIQKKKESLKRGDTHFMSQKFKVIGKRWK
jgi:hypothetical protein